MSGPIKLCCDERLSLDHVEVRKLLYCDGVDDPACSIDSTVPCETPGTPCPPVHRCTGTGDPCVTIGVDCDDVLECTEGINVPCTPIDSVCGETEGGICALVEEGGTCAEVDPGTCLEGSAFTGSTGYESESELLAIPIWNNGEGSLNIDISLTATACREAVEELPDPESEEELGRSPPPLLDDRIYGYVACSIRCGCGLEESWFTGAGGNMTDVGPVIPDGTLEFELAGAPGGGTLAAVFSAATSWGPGVGPVGSSQRSNACHAALRIYVLLQAQHADGSPAAFAIANGDAHAVIIEAVTSAITCCADKATFVIEDIDPLP